MKPTYNLTVTRSVHTAYQHTHDWYQRHGLSPGLAWYCEQAIETAHSEFYDKVWVRGYKVPETSDQYPDKLIGAMGKFNSERIC